MADETKAPETSAPKTSAQEAKAKDALRQKNEGAQPPSHPPTEDHADKGMKSIPFEDQPPSGAFDAEGHRPVLERSRKVR